jgi:hypothetical protein
LEFITANTSSIDKFLSYRVQPGAAVDYLDVPFGFVIMSVQRKMFGMFYKCIPIHRQIKLDFEHKQVPFSHFISLNILDYIIGSPNALLQEKDDFYDLVETYLGKTLRLYIYNWQSNKCREIAINPDRNWGGEGRCVTI